MIYHIIYSLVWEKILPPILRSTKHLEWGKVLTKPLQWLNDLNWDEYIGINLTVYFDIATNYNKGDKVYGDDRAIYEALSNTIGNPLSDDVIWLKVLDNHIGVRERVKYNSQKILFEFALNRWFNVLAAPLIYIQNNTIYTGTMVMDRSSTDSSVIARDSNYSQSYMGNNPAYNNIAFTIFVPLAVFNALAATNTERENIIRNFADKYVLAGIIYDVQTY